MIVHLPSGFATICVCGMLAACGATSTPAATSAVIGRAGTSVVAARLSSSDAPFRFFSSSSFWNEPVPADAPLDPTSAEVMSAFDALIASEQE
ncbi:MAG: hypothetical protein ACLP1Q_19735, partial [Solirubrobacteraceae bacterium]